MTMKERIFSIIGGTSPKSKSFEVFIIALIIGSIIEITLESFQNFEHRHHFAFTFFEILTLIIFTIEYILRLWTADLKYPGLSPFRARLKYMGSPIGIIDLLAILPFYLPFIFQFDLRFIRILRLLALIRILKFHRYTKSFKLVLSIFVDKRSELFITVFISFILLLISSATMYNLENKVQPEQFPNIIATFWWAIATLTTVGYGDVYPITPMGKLVSGIISLLAIGLVALPTGIISAGFIEKVESKKNDVEKNDVEKTLDYNYCPHCGKQLK